MRLLGQIKKISLPQNCRGHKRQPNPSTTVLNVAKICHKGRLPPQPPLIRLATTSQDPMLVLAPKRWVKRVPSQSMYLLFLQLQRTPQSPKKHQQLRAEVEIVADRTSTPKLRDLPQNRQLPLSNFLQTKTRRKQNSKLNRMQRKIWPVILLKKRQAAILIPFNYLFRAQNKSLTSLFQSKRIMLREKREKIRLNKVSHSQLLKI